MASLRNPILSFTNIDSVPSPKSDGKYYFKWTPHKEFDDEMFEAKKEHLQKLNSLFAEAKTKRKQNKAPRKTYSDTKAFPKKTPKMGFKFGEKHLEKNPDLLYSATSTCFSFDSAELASLDSDGETEDEKIAPLSFSVTVNDEHIYIPQKQNYAAFDISNDGFAIVPEFQEVLPKEDAQSVVLSKKSFQHRDNRFRNLKKRKAVSLVVDTLFHKWDSNYVSDNNLSGKELENRKKIRFEFSRVAWRDIVKREIRKNFNQRVSIFETKQKQHKVLAESACVLLRRRYELPNAKEIHSRARKIVYEMQTFWRKVDREGGDTKRKRTKDIITERKKFHSEKEVKRQSQRLDFLLRQTEIFSHFIGARMGIDLDKLKGNKKEEEKEPKSDLESTKDDTKAAKAAIEFMNRRKKKAKAFEKEITEVSGNKSYQKIGEDENITEIDLLNPSTMPTMTNIKEPEMFVGSLKSYQSKGLNWLVNLYEHSINGILADEMGLGKTIQSIAFIAHLCEKENLWGPYLVVAPNSVVHNWCYEFEQFTPSIKVLPYWGQQKDRETLRKFWKAQFLYSSEGEFHVLVTSYSTFQTDEKHFKKMKWQFIILDEAQAIKNAQSQRWKSLLSIECRNRLLLTGTPIQNSMAELWSLLHYIMPSIFQKHHDFKEWFSRNIEDHAEGKSQKLNSAQLKRLHMILKPFMLRRVKHDVEHEMAPKKEIVIKCELSSRQRILYNAVKDQFRSDFSKRNQDKLAGEKDLYNAVMQFRKVCNHPNIYQKRLKKTPLSFNVRLPPQILLTNLPKEEIGKRILHFEFQNPICFRIPRCVDNEKCQKMDAKYFNKFNVFGVENINGNENFAFAKFFKMTLNEIESYAKSDKLLRWIFDQQKEKNWLNIKKLDFRKHFKNLDEYPNLIKNAFIPVIQAPKITLLVSKKKHEKIDTIEKAILLGTQPQISNLKFLAKNFGKTFRIAASLQSPIKNKRFFSKKRSTLENGHFGDFDFPLDILMDFKRTFGTNMSKIEKLSKDQLLTDCGKLTALDKLLKEKRKNGHRVLIFSQMTKMLDILQDYCHIRRYKFLRLDGSTQITDRTIMVKQFQRDTSVFIFLLSTRAGGLGINLTAADTVIFYDNDWNPTMDAQAMDRVHRIGQKKQVTVYRIICSNTVEERVWKVAQQKFKIQKSVYSGGFKFAKEKRKKKSSKSPNNDDEEDSKIFKPNQLKKMILDDESD